MYLHVTINRARGTVRPTRSAMPHPDAATHEGGLLALQSL